MRQQAQEIADLLKVLANDNRLLLLCHLIDQPLSVNMLCEKIPHISQSALSQHLALLRTSGFVRYQKVGQTVTYSISDPRVEKLINFLKQYYCHP